MNKSGKIFVIEGIDSSGKSTVCNMLRNQLLLDGIDVEIFHFPGKNSNALGRVVYDIHHNPNMFDNKLPPLSLQTLHVAAHIDMWINYINTTISKGKHIILDRFWWSTYVYGKNQFIDPEILFSLINVEKSCYDASSISHYFYFIREDSGNHSTTLNSYYFELIQMNEHKDKTTVIRNDSDILTVYNKVYSVICDKIDE